MTPRTQTMALIALIAAGAAAMTAALFLGATPLGPGRVLAGLFGSGAGGDRVVVWEIRLPRAIAAYLVGAALGVSGAALQGLLRNPLAEPGVLGVSATASLGATIAIYFGPAALWAPAAPVAAAAGALAATALIAAASRLSASVVTLILVGVGLSSFAGAVTALLMNFAPNPFTLSDLVSWSLGSVANRSFEDIALAAPFIGAGVGILFTARRGLGPLTLGDEAASGVGLDGARLRLLIVAGAGLASGGAVALAGAVGFVGLLAPHAARPLVDHDPARTLTPSALIGGLTLLLADILVRTAPTDAEMRLGVVAALAGAPLFVWVALRARPVQDGD